jgi:hypothetical protein
MAMRITMAFEVRSAQTEFLGEAEGFKIFRKLRNSPPSNSYRCVSQLKGTFRSPQMSPEHTLGRSHQDHEVD